MYNTQYHWNLHVITNITCFIHWVVFELQLFFLLLCGPSSRKHSATTLWNVWSKNNCISRTLLLKHDLYHYVGKDQHISVILILGLMCSLGCPQWEKMKWKFTVMSLREQLTQLSAIYPSVFKAATVTNIRRAAAGSCSFQTVQKFCWKMLHKRNRKQCPRNTIHSRLSNVSNCYVTSSVSWNDIRTPFFRCHLVDITFVCVV